MGQRTCLVTFTTLLFAASGAAGEPAPTPAPTPADLTAINEVLKKLGTAMVAGDAPAVGALISPGRGENARREITRYATEEFAANRYEKFEFKPLEVGSLRTEEGSELSAHAEVDYDIIRPDGERDASKNSYLFTFVRHESRWYVSHSRLFDQFTGVNPQSFIGRVIKLSILIFIAIAFWGWMLVDCGLRYRKLGPVVGIFLTPPIGALLYFLFGWIRGPKIISPEADSNGGKT